MRLKWAFFDLRGRRTYSPKTQTKEKGCKWRQTDLKNGLSWILCVRGTGFFFGFFFCYPTDNYINKFILDVGLYIIDATSNRLVFFFYKNLDF